ncbi:MAG: hypothetical protein HY609_03000, partial [Deltaproteobacteria bacterium]|nr:hypothetical protein [Deltaproteobacteria bacterium]
MLSAGEIKGPTGNVFEDAMKLPEKLADNLRHQSISDLPVVDCEGCPTVRDEYLTNVHEPRFFEYPQGGTYVQYFKPGEYERRKKEAEEVIKNPNATAEAWEKAASILSMFGFPADPKEANALLRRMQSSPDLFTFVDLEISVEITSDGEAKQVTRQKEKPLQIGRSEDGKRVWVFEKNLVLEKPCQGNKPLLFNTLRGVHLTDLDILRLTTLLQAHENDFCVDNGSNGQRTLAVAKDYSVEDIDDRFVPLIAGSKFFAGRAGEIAAALEKSFEKERTQKRLQESQEGAWWKGPLIGVLAGSPIALATLGLFIKMYQMQKKAMEGKADVDVNEFIKDVTEKLKTEKPKIVVVPEVEEIVNKVRAAMDSKHPHIILAGRSGSGKDLIARYLQWLFLNDQIPLRRNKTPKKAGSIDATGMASTGGLFKGMAAKVANALNKVWLGKPGIYHAQEIQNWLTIVESSGYGPGSTSTNAFRMVLHTLETDNPDFTVIGTTSEIEKITAAVNDIERRMGKIIRIPDFSPESLRAILDAITAETLQVYGITLADIDLSSKIIAATKFLEQSPNSGVVNLLDEICREAEQKGQTSVTADDVARMVQEKAAVLNISLSENAARKALDFIEKYPSIEPDRARIAAQLIEYGKNPELVFAQDHELQMALEEGQREMARRSNGGSKKPPGGTPPAAPSGGDGGPS